MLDLAICNGMVVDEHGRRLLDVGVRAGAGYGAGKQAATRAVSGHA